MLQQQIHPPRTPSLPVPRHAAILAASQRCESQRRRFQVAQAAVFDVSVCLSPLLQQIRLWRAAVCSCMQHHKPWSGYEYTIGAMHNPPGSCPLLLPPPPTPKNTPMQTCTLVAVAQNVGHGLSFYEVGQFMNSLVQQELTGEPQHRRLGLVQRRQPGQLLAGRKVATRALTYTTLPAAAPLLLCPVADVSPTTCVAVLAAGLLTSVSPCTLSVLPLTIGYIAGYAGDGDNSQQQQQQQSEPECCSSSNSSAAEQPRQQQPQQVQDAAVPVRPPPPTANSNSSSRSSSSSLTVQAVCFSLGLASSLAALGVVSSSVGRAYGSIGAGLPSLVALVAIVMGLNLLEVREGGDRL